MKGESAQPQRYRQVSLRGRRLTAFRSGPALTGARAIGHRIACAVNRQPDPAPTRMTQDCRSLGRSGIPGDGEDVNLSDR